MTTEDRSTLESLLDRYTLSEVLDGLAHIAGEKAEHVSANWQDARLSRAWDKAQTRLMHVAASPTIIAVS